MHLDGDDLIHRIVRDLLDRVAVTSSDYLEAMSMRTAGVRANSFDVRFKNPATRNAFYHVAGSPSEPGGSSRLVISLVYPVDYKVPSAACVSANEIAASLRVGGWRAEPFPDFHEQIDMRQYRGAAREMQFFRADGAAVSFAVAEPGCITSLAVIFFRKG